MRYLGPAFVAFAALACLAVARPLQAQGGPTTQDLAPFHALDLTGAANVTLQQGTSERLSVDPLAPGVRLDATVRQGVLSVNVRDERHWWSRLAGDDTRGVRITIGFRSIDAVEVNGAVSVQATTLDVPELRLSASGGTRVRIDNLRTQLLRVDGAGAFKASLAGSATRQRVSIAGAGDYDAARLASEVVGVDVSGVARVVVNASKTLDAEISGAGSIAYTGDPEVHPHVSGVGKIRRISGDAALRDGHSLASRER